MKRASKDFYAHGYELILYVAGSEEEHRKMAASFGAKYIHFQNKPISNKMQALMEFSMKDYWDYWMAMGSDDFFTEIYAANQVLYGVDMAVKQLKSGENAGMAASMYVFSTHNRNRGFEFKECGRIGAGRWYKREVLDKVKDGIIYPSGINRLLDHGSEELICKSTGVRPTIFNDESYLADVKTSDNITSFKRLCGFRRFEDHFALSLFDYVPEFKDLSVKKAKVK